MLSATGIEFPRITAVALLAHVLGVSRTQLLARPERPLSTEAQQHYQQLVHRAAEGEPLAYLTGTREFHGLDFAVNTHVLVPRPETELLVDEALRFLTTQSTEKRVLDVGTGSGCIAVTIAAKCPAASVTALDVSEDALAMARINAERHGVAGRISFARSDLLSSVRYLPSAFHLLCANLPYIATDELRGLPVAKHEPHLALDGGPDGLLWVRRLLVDAPRVVAPDGLLLLEIGATQGPMAAALAQAAFPAAHVAVLKDYAGLDRIVRIQT
ncbi:MAG: peptide chain release factor N(5)-glutamine methyltransferase [Anaerolineales bacterium]